MELCFNRKQRNKNIHILKMNGQKSPKPNEELEKEQQLLCHQYFKNRYLTVFLFSQCHFTEYIHIVSADYFHILTT